MNDRRTVAIGYATEQIRKALRIIDAAGISAKPINLILIGLAGIKREIRKEERT